MDVIVDENNTFLDNPTGDGSLSIYEAENPYGPYTCMACGAQFEVLDDTREPSQGPSQRWKDAHTREYHDVIKATVKDTLQLAAAYSAQLYGLTKLPYAISEDEFEHITQLVMEKETPNEETILSVAKEVIK